MPAIPKLNLTRILAVLLATSSFARAEDPTALRQRLESKYPLTTFNAEGAVVTQGAVLTLQKGGLKAGGSSVCTSDYRDGHFTLDHPSMAACNGDKLNCRLCVYIPHSDAARSAAQATRAFVAGEKLYLERIDLGDGVAFLLRSDAINGVTYKTKVRFQPGAAQADQLVAEVFSVAPPDAPPSATASESGPGTSTVATPTSTQEGPQRPLTPPPPPPDEPPPTLTQGSTVDQVVAILGPPVRILDVGPKKIYMFNHPDLKITFVDGKITDAI
jgi:hypothetical protein